METGQYLDVEKEPIPPMSEWANLSQQQQLALLSKLNEKLYVFQGRPEFTRPLQQGVAYLNSLVLGGPKV